MAFLSFFNPIQAGDNTGMIQTMLAGKNTVYAVSIVIFRRIFNFTDLIKCSQYPGDSASYGDSRSDVHLAVPLSFVMTLSQNLPGAPRERSKRTRCL